MIQITAIPRLDPYHRSRPLSDFTSCPNCGQVYQPAYRSIFCPHAMGPARQIGAGAALVRVKLGRKPGKRPPLVLEDPYWEIQKGETLVRHNYFKIFRDLGPGRSLIKVARQCQKQYSMIRRIREEDKWDVRVAAFDRDQDRIHLALLREAQKKRVKQDLVVIDAGRQIIAAELRATLKTLKRGQSLGMPVETMVASYEKLVKLARLINDESTENIVTEGAEVIRQRKFRDAVTSLQAQFDAWRAAHSDLPEEQVELYQTEMLEIAVNTYTGIDPKELKAAVLGTVDDSSTATN